MTDETKPPKRKPAGAAKRPRKLAPRKAKPAGASGRRPGGPDAVATGDADGATADVTEPAVAAADAGAGDPAVAEGIAGDEPASTGEPGDERYDSTDLPAGSEPTAVPAGDTTEPTDWLPAAEAGPTQVLAPEGGGTPPFTPVPRVVKTSGGGDRRAMLWIILAVAVIAVVAVLLVWALAVRDTGEQFVGTWAPAGGEGGGLDIHLQDDSFRVSVYDPDLSFVGTFPAVRDDDVLTFRFSDDEAGLGLLEARLTYLEERDVLVLQLAGVGQEGAEMEYVRVDKLEEAPAATPTPTGSPTAQPTGSPSPSASPTPSPTGTESTENDQRVVDGIVALQVGILNWASANSNTFPPVAEVGQGGGVAQYVSPWPTNPFTGQPMVAGDQPGDYTYEQLNGGQGYRLVGHLANGFTFTVP